MDIDKMIALKGLKRFLENLSLDLVIAEEGKGLSTNDLTDLLKERYDHAYNHTKLPHAPSNAQENVIENITNKGIEMPIINKTVNLQIPDRTSDLLNDLGFLSEHPKIYISPNTSDTVNINYGSSVQVIGNIVKDPNGHIMRIDLVDLKFPEAYNHPTSGVTPGSYKMVTVNAEGHVISGSNPTTRDEYGLTDVMTRKEVEAMMLQNNESIPKIGKIIVTALPSTSDADPNMIYMILKNPGKGDNIYNEYMMINHKWEKLGDTEVSLDGYVHESDIIPITYAEIDMLFD